MKKIFFFLSFLLFLVSFQAQAQTPVTGISDGGVPKDIQIIIDRDSKTWTTEEKEKVTGYVISTNSPSVGSTGPSLPGTVNCFDYYHFGSVQVDLSTTLSQTVPGATIGFSGEIKNNNVYPIVDGQVYVKIFKVKNGDFNQENGSALVDQFPLEEMFVIPALGSKKITFSWNVPENAEGGEYTAAFFFQTSKRYNLLGLSFTDDVTGNQVHFSVISDDDKGTVALDKNTVTLNNQTHRFAAFPLRFAKDENVKVVVRIVNPRNEAVTVPVVWKLYAWDSLREEALRDTKIEAVQLKPKEIKEISYTALPIKEIVSYLVVETSDQASKSILNIRFARDGIEETRINFPSIVAYPLEKNKENNIFSCVHSIGDGVVKDNSLTLTLRDEKERVIHTYTYEGDITSAMMGIKDSFVPLKNYTTFSLTANLKHKGKTVEEVRVVYDCRDIDVNSCPKPMSTTTKVIIVVTVLLFIFAFGKILKNKGIIPLAVYLLIVLPALFLGTPNSAEAKSVSVTQSLPILGFYEGSANPGGNGIGGISTTVTYNATVSLFGADLVDGSSIPSGSTVRVQWAPGSSNTSWVGTGGTYDSPYGRWDSSAKSCTTYSDCYGINTIYGSFYRIIYQGDMAITPPSFSISGSGLTCGTTLGGVRTSGPYNAFMCQYVPSPTYCATVVSYSPFYADCVVTALSGESITMNVAYPSASGAMRAGEFVSYDSGSTATYSRSGGLSFSVPAQAISFSFVAAPPSSPPTTPTVTYQNPSLVNTPVDFTVTSTDADGDNIRYGFDWDRNNTIDEWVPSVGYVSSGTSQTVSHTWSTTGYKYFNAKTQDINNNYSTQVLKSINIVSTIVNGVCGPANGTTRLTTAPTSGLCDAGTLSFVMDGGTYYRWDCRGTNGTDSVCYAYKNKTPTASISSPTTNITINTSQSQQFTGTATDLDADGTIVAYEWRTGGCSSGTLLSSLASFVHQFSAGTYRVYFRGKDDSGVWSTNCPNRLITVNTPDPINGVCGSANGAASQNKPTSNLCNTVGLPGPVVSPENISVLPESGTPSSWTWTCAGEYGGTDVSCSSNTSCGDNKCQRTKGESPATCRADCKVKFFEF